MTYTAEQKADKAIEWCKQIDRRLQQLQEQIDHLTYAMRKVTEAPERKDRPF
jgi:prefoldin subunit 5